jgi:hypothetical protein
MNNLYKSIVRASAGFVIAGAIWLTAHLGFSISPTISAWLAGAVGSAYGVVVRFVEVKVPKAGILLGAIGAPEYPVSGANAVAPVTPITSVTSSHPSVPPAA